MRAAKNEGSRTLSDVKKHALKAVDDTVKSVQKQMDETARQLKHNALPAFSYFNRRIYQIIQ